MAGSDPPLVSIVLPVFNRAEELPRAAASVLRQSYRDIELIIVDDGSTDDTTLVARRIASGDGRVRLVTLDENRGAAVARNEGIRLSRGRYVAFQDSDDEWSVTKLERQLGTLRSLGRRAAACYCRFEMESPAGWTVVPDGPAEPFHGDIGVRLLSGNVVGTPTLLVERELLETVEGFDASLRALEDWDLALRLAFRTQFGFVDAVLVRAHRGVGSVNARADLLTEWAVLKKHWVSAETSGDVALARHFQRQSLRYASRGLLGRAAKLASVAYGIERRPLGWAWGYVQALRRGAAKCLSLRPGGP